MIDMRNDPNFLALLAKSRKRDDFPQVGLSGSQRFDLALVDRGFPLTMVRDLTINFIAFARRPNTPMKEVGGGQLLGFTQSILDDMMVKWDITEADLKASTAKAHATNTALKGFKK